MGEDWYRMQGIDVVETDRGGKVTYHGPGQLVGYPIMGVTDVVAFVRTMESAIVDALAEEGISARARPDEGRDFTGVWVAGPQDRVDRRARRPWRHDARLRGERRQRPPAVRVGRPLRPGRRADDLDHAREADRRPPAAFRARMAAQFARAHGLEPVEVERARLDEATAIHSHAR